MSNVDTYRNVGIGNRDVPRSIWNAVNAGLVSAYHEFMRAPTYGLFTAEDRTWEPRGLQQQNRDVVRALKQQGHTEYIDGPITARGNKIITDYVQSDLFAQRALELKTHNFANATPDKQDELRVDLIGAIFADIALDYLKVRFPGEAVGEAFETWKTFHPDKEVVRQPFGLSSIRGISVPDAEQVVLVGNEAEIKRVFEFTTAMSFEKKHWFMKPENFRKAYREKIPKLFLDSDAEFVFVVPVDSPLTDISDKALEEQGCDLIEVPMHAAVVIRILDQIIEEALLHPDPLDRPDVARGEVLNQFKAKGKQVDTLEVRRARATGQQIHENKSANVEETTDTDDYAPTRQSVEELLRRAYPDEPEEVFKEDLAS